MIPIAQTTIKVLREKTVVAYTEPTYSGDEDLPARDTVASGVRASISSPSGGSSRSPGDRNSLTAKLQCDPFRAGLDTLDLIQDETTGIFYKVDWASLRQGAGLDHWEAGLSKQEGLS